MFKKIKKWQKALSALIAIVTLGVAVSIMLPTVEVHASAVSRVDHYDCRETQCAEGRARSVATVNNSHGVSVRARHWVTLGPDTILLSTSPWSSGASSASAVTPWRTSGLGHFSQGQASVGWVN